MISPPKAFDRIVSVVFLQLTLFLASLGCAAAWAATGTLRQADPLAAHHLLSVEDGSVWGWGDNSYGQLGPAGGATWATPRRIDALRPMIAVAAGGRHSLALDGEGQVWAWGDNSSGQLGLGHTKPTKTAALVPGLGKIRAIAAGIHHSLALSEDGTVWSWGSNSRGQLGYAPAGAFEAVAVPTRVSGLTGAVAVAAGGDFSLSLDKDGKISAYGSGSLRVQPVTGLGVVAEIKAQGGRAYALGREGQAWTWIAVSPASAMRAEKSSADAFKAFAADGRDEVTMVSGSVISAAGKGVPGVHILAGRNPCTETAASGRYFCVLPRDWQGTLQAVKAGGRFERSPAGSAHEVNKAATTALSVTSIDFVAAPPLMRITGRVQASGRGVKIRVSGVGANCGTVKPNGQYICTVPKGWHGTLSATRPGYVYAPRNYAAVGTALTGQDFVGQIATAAKPAIIPAPVSPAPQLPRPSTATAPASPVGPAPKAAEAAPAALPDAPRASTAQAPLAQEVHIAGTLYISGSGDGRSFAGRRRIANATIAAEGAQCTNSDDAGNYMCTARAGWSGRVVPRKSNYRFTPSALAYSGLRQDQRNQDFAATYEPNED